MSAEIIALPITRHAPQPTKPAHVRGSDVHADLRRAQLRIAQLEASLAKAMRDSLQNFDRARAAERALEDLRRSG